MNAKPRKIAIIGAAGSGKTTLANRLGDAYLLPVLEGDSFVWGPNWEHVEVERLRVDVSNWMSGKNAWIIEMAATRTADLFWTQADILIWLDPPLRQSWPRVARRSSRQLIRREELWHGNKRTLGNALWTIKEQPKIHRYTRRRYPEVLTELGISNERIIRITNSRELEEYLDQVFPH